MILFKRLWKERQERPDVNQCQGDSWLLVAVFLLIVCLFWILWMHEWLAAGMPELPAHPQREISRCCE